MEEFIKSSSDKLQVFKKNVFTYKHSYEFLKKLCERGDINKMESELNKCLLNSSSKDQEERISFIKYFMENFQIFTNDNIKINISPNNPLEADSDIRKINKSELMFGTKSATQNEDFSLKKFKIKNKEQDFPTLENLELVNRKKNFDVLNHHYFNKLEKGIKICFCMSSKHPLVGNCTNCGRIQCLQEGDKECIVCGTEIIKKDDYLKLCADDKEMKKAYGHKEKLLKFQSDFYSKLQIIDDFSDWYEISNNTWITKENRELAKKRDDEIDKIRENPEFEYNINFKTLEITKIYEQVDDKQVKEEVANFFVDNLKKAKEAKAVKECRAISENAIRHLNELARKKMENTQKSIYEENIQKLSKRIDLNTNEKIGEELTLYNKHLLSNIENMSEHDNFPLDTDVGMCLSMHQPWASLVIEGFKRFEGREWDSDYRGILWIHATSKKPDKDLIDSVEGECEELYKNCKNKPNFPKRYPTSCLLGCVDLVDVLKRDVYNKLIHPLFREKTESKFLFVVKNPKKLEIPLKMPGQPNIFKLEENILERTMGKLLNVNTFWWPCANLNVNLIEMPFTFLLKKEGATESHNGAIPFTSKKNNKKKIQSNKIKITTIHEDNFKNNISLIQNFLSNERKENILSLLDSIKKDMTYCADYLKEPYLNYGLHTSFSDSKEEVPILLREIFKELQNLVSSEKKLKMEIKLKDVIVEYLDWYGLQNFRKNDDISIKLLIGNPIIISILNDLSDSEGKAIRLDCGDIVLISGDIFYSTKVFYDTLPGKNVKSKQGALIISFNCSNF
jgi:hypothetical protein